MDFLTILKSLADGTANFSLEPGLTEEQADAVRLAIAAIQRLEQRNRSLEGLVTENVKLRRLLQNIPRPDSLPPFDIDSGCVPCWSCGRQMNAIQFAWGWQWVCPIGEHPMRDITPEELKHFQKSQIANA